METAKLKKYAQFARRSLIEQIAVKMKLVLAEDSAARREYADAVRKLEEAIRQIGPEQVAERVAYIWFNRFCALRFMDVNRYTRIGVVSPAEGQFQPEILADAKMGHIDEDMVPDTIRQRIFALLDGKATSSDPQGEAYRLLVVAACNDWHRAMPFLFERIDDYTELLMPDDLLSGNSILAYTREAMTPDACQDVEVIGWLYQFYISEKKDEVFEGLKKNRKITPENIPAATQLFTPHWIVRYLVENSLGRMWMLNRPGSRLAERMEYYIKPEQAETDFLRIASPEEIKICDPACGSGHMLTYAFDLLYAIYEEDGYEPAEIPEKILTHNLYGIEIDERAGELAAFALTMKAQARQRRFFRKSVQPNICVLENVRFDEGELKTYMDFVGRDLFTPALQNTLRQFEEADNFGSLIRPELTDAAGILKILETKNVSGQLFLDMTHRKVLRVLEQAEYLSPKYHVVVANPPYMGIRGLNNRLGALAKENYPSSKTDLFAMFIERNLELAQHNGFVAMITMQSWMFLSTFEKLRSYILAEDTLVSMAHLGARAFDSIGGEVVSTTAFILSKSNNPLYRGDYLRLIDGSSESEKEHAIREAIQNANCGWLFRASADDFLKIPGSPTAYWLSAAEFQLFKDSPKIGDLVKPRQGMSTNDNQRFLRRWFEVNSGDAGYGCSSSEKAVLSQKRWFPYNKGGEFRRWSGNNEYLVNWKNDGEEIKHWLVNNPQDPNTTHWSRRIINTEFYFKEGLTWSFVSSSNFGIRYTSEGFLFDVGGSSMFPRQAEIKPMLGYLCSKVAFNFLRAVNPTLNFQTGNVASLPWPQEKIKPFFPELNNAANKLIKLSKSDWNSYETSWDFSTLPLLQPDCRQSTLEATYQTLRARWHDMTTEMRRLEEENNRIFIDAYGLQDELTLDVPLSEITLTCNPHYRYGGDKSDAELEALLLADTMREFISYAVGCMFGRYALEKPGLVLANQGETLEDYLKQIPDPDFPADADNVIPLLDGDWFTDDIAGRFRTFLRVTFGEERYKDNLAFVELALGKNGKSRDIRDYFLKDFYGDYVRRYKKRPIYWLFSSPRGSFNALVYMHRYRPDTAGLVLNNYLREFRGKLASRRNYLEAVSIGADSSQGEKTKALKEIEKIVKTIAELEEYERDVLYPLATRQLEIDLDDGVKVNYCKFGSALKPIPGLDVVEDE